MPCCASWREDSRREGPSCPRRPHLPHGRPRAAVAIAGVVVLLRPLQARARIKGEMESLSTSFSPSLVSWNGCSPPLLLRRRGHAYRRCSGGSREAAPPVYGCPCRCERVCVFVFARRVRERPIGARRSYSGRLPSSASRHRDVTSPLLSLTALARCQVQTSRGRARALDLGRPGMDLVPCAPDLAQLDRKSVV